MRTWIYPGSFDPITRGHLDVIRRVRPLCDRLIVAVLHNTQKKAFFDVQTRMALIQQCVGDLSGVEVDSFQGLTVDYARLRGATAIVRGLRAVSDFENELQMAGLNRKLCPGLETVFVMTDVEQSFVSSTMVREIGTLGGDISLLVPTEIVEDVAAALRLPHKEEQP
jgi:pantetheine-phosphate adenylyltransferase